MKIGVWFGLGLALIGPAAASAQTDFDAFAEAVAARWMREDPEGATTAQYFAGAEQDALDRQLAAVGPSGFSLDPARRQAGLAAMRREREQLQGFDRRRLTPAQRLTADAMEESMTVSLAAVEFEDHSFCFNQMGGLHVGVVNFLSESHPIRQRRDVENYLVRLAQVAGVLDRAIEWTREQDGRGLRLPRFILQPVLGQVDQFLAEPAAGNVLVTSLDERAAKVKELPAADRTAASAAAAKIVGEEILPAYRRLRALIADQITRATDDTGLWRLPRGGAAYAIALRRNTGTDLRAEEIHALGLREVARIEAEMDRLLRELGYREGSVTARYAALNEKLLPPADPDPRPALVAEYARVLRDAEKRSETLFDLRPKAPIEVRRVPALTESTMAARYTAPAPDGSKPGIFWAPLPEGYRKVIWTGAGLRSVTYHEGVPGHHFQIALRQELTNVPRFVRLNVFGNTTAYAEGWALYAERLAAEAGWYEGDLPGRVGQLNFELFRARRLVVDTGLHAKRWTRQQAIDYGIQPSEVDRYVVWPGQACSYKIGELEILRLRATAQTALGPRFSLKQFHNVVLGSGDVSLKTLGRLVDEFIAAAR